MKMYCRKQVVFWDIDNRGFLFIFSPLMKMLHGALVLAGGLLTDAWPAPVLAQVYHLTLAEIPYMHF